MNTSLPILLVEDNAFNQKVALRLLEKLGHQIDLATNGIEAITAVQQRTYPIVFMDIQMPEMDGIEATRCIRSGSNDQPWIIAMTGNISDEDRQSCIEAGMDDYISKPLQLAKLAEAIERFSNR
jgi:CheY-like chemotaxis protein